MAAIERTETTLATGAERLFSGQIGEEYDMLRFICPAAGEISRKVGEFVQRWESGALAPVGVVRVVEVGCGTGITTGALLRARDDLGIVAVDVEPTMLDQARVNLAEWLDAGRLSLVESDALSFLRAQASASVDVLASAYTFHNFLDVYRRQVIAEVHRVLKPGGLFINGDRYALDDGEEHTRLIQREAKHYFATFAPMRRYDLLESWIIHLFSDESPDHVMRLQAALESYRAAGFSPVVVHDRDQNNALVTAEKPVP
jgi:ubiquinone/menaquinone biosynthesis C-methylase UbiE